jgi:polar amino acid transport system permease protein
MSRFEAIRTIVLPQALVRMLPPLGSLFVIAIKDSAIAGLAIGVPELLRQSQIVVGKSFRPFEIYTALLIVYFLLCYPVARGVDRLYRRVAHLGSS